MNEWPDQIMPLICLWCSRNSYYGTDHYSSSSLSIPRKYQLVLIWIQISMSKLILIVKAIDEIETNGTYFQKWILRRSNWRRCRSSTSARMEQESWNGSHHQIGNQNGSCRFISSLYARNDAGVLINTLRLKTSSKLILENQGCSLISFGPFLSPSLSAGSFFSSFWMRSMHYGEIWVEEGNLTSFSVIS